MNTVKFKMYDSEEVDCLFKLSRFNDYTLAIDLVSTDGEPITRLTKCINPDYLVFKNVPRDLAYVDINNNPTAENFIKYYNLGIPIMINDKIAVYKSGFCIYPLYKFNICELLKYSIPGQPMI